MTREGLFRLFARLLLSLGIAHSAQAQSWQLIWQDEFNGSIGPHWVFETGRGGNGWGNNELQYYRRGNASIENGALVITARREDFGGARYTSARLKTQGLKSFRFGRIEARIQLSSGLGQWPAFWMLGANLPQVGWPASGEIDVMERVNTENRVFGTIHWQDNNGQYAQYSGNLATTPEDWHVYAVEWDTNAIRWFVDGVKYHEANIAGGVNGTSEFQNDFFLLLNLAIGGNWPGFNIDESRLPARMRVDYVRVYAPSSQPTGLASWGSRNIAGAVLRHQGGRGRIDAAASVNPVADGNWNLVPGLAGSGLSFQSQNFPDRYLRHRGGEVWLDANDGSQQFRDDASFIAQPGLDDAAATSFQSFNFRDRWLRHRGSLLYVEAAVTPQDRADATFARLPALQGFSTLLDAAALAQQQGLQLEACNEGGQNLGWIDANDWVVWNLNLPASGNYRVEYRVASLSGGGRLQLERAGGGAVYGALDVPRTNGWQTWTTVSHTVALSAGSQQIAVKALAGGWNLKSLRIVRE